MTNETQVAADWENYDFVPGAREYMTECEQEWRAAGLMVAWIDTHPKWVSVVHWSWRNDQHTWEPLIDPEGSCRRAWRFTLIGGGQIKITEYWTDRPLFVGDTFLPREERTTLTVSAHTAQGLRVHHGEIDGAVAEMSAYAVLLRGAGEQTQAIAERAALTLRALTACDESSEECTHPDRDRFYALLDGATGCSICGRPLRDEVSKLVGVGPDCARQWGIPHSRAAASKRLELRKKMLGEAAS
jgi:Family of unknown function (DUF6011)